MRLEVLERGSCTTVQYALGGVWLGTEDTMYKSWKWKAHLIDEISGDGRC